MLSELGVPRKKQEECQTSFPQNCLLRTSFFFCLFSIIYLLAYFHMCVMYTCVHVGVCMYGAEADMGGVFLNVSPLGLLRRGALTEPGPHQQS